MNNLVEDAADGDRLVFHCKHILAYVEALRYSFVPQIPGTDPR